MLVFVNDGILGAPPQGSFFLRIGDVEIDGVLSEGEVDESEDEESDTEAVLYQKSIKMPFGMGTFSSSSSKFCFSKSGSNVYRANCAWWLCHQCRKVEHFHHL